MQQSIFDQAEKAKQDGIELVYRHADSYWKRAAADQLYKVAKTKKEFTSEDVLIPLESKGITTGDNRAMAAILQSFSRANLIVATDKYVRCQRKSRHRAPIMVWRSKIAGKL